MPTSPFSTSGGTSPQLKAIIPPESVGKVFGFVFVGYSLGISLAPPVFGWVRDIGEPGFVFLLAAVFAVASILVLTAEE